MMRDVTLTALFALGLVTAGCASHHTGETVGRKLDQIEGNVGQAVGTAAEKTGQKLDEAGQKIQQKLAPSN